MSVFMSSQPLPEWDDDYLLFKFRDVMDTLELTNNTSSLAELARRAGEIWGELQARQVKIRL